MTTHILKENFKFSPDGIRVDSYPKGAAVTGAAAESAEKQGKIVKPKRAPEPADKPLENAAAPLTLETKGN